MRSTIRRRHCRRSFCRSAPVLRGHRTHRPSIRMIWKTDAGSGDGSRSVCNRSEGDRMRHPLVLPLFCIALLAGTSAAQLVMVTPPQVVLSKGQKVQLQAYLYQQSGIAKIVTNTSTWTSLQPTIATVTKTGLVTMKGTGTDDRGHLRNDSGLWNGLESVHAMQQRSSEHCFRGKHS